MIEFFCDYVLGSFVTMLLAEIIILRTIPNLQSIFYSFTMGWIFVPFFAADAFRNLLIAPNLESFLFMKEIDNEDISNV